MSIAAVTTTAFSPAQKY